MCEYRAVLRNWADVTGRLSRRGFWTYLVLTLALGVAVSVLGAALALVAEPMEHLGTAYAAVVAAPTATAAVRRLHDGGYSGRLILVGLVPFVGRVALVSLLARSQDTTENRYGTVPVRS